MIKTLQGVPVQCIVEGTDYLVPTVHGIPVVLPAHVDEGNDGATSRHWHTDGRWGDVGRGIEVWTDSTRKACSMIAGDKIRAAILKDEGQSVVYKQLTAKETIIWPSGGVFCSIVWLYYHYGHMPAKDGHCVHHHTQLQEQKDGDLQCPAHALRYKSDGSPRFKGPFYLRIRYTDPNHRYVIKWAKEEVQFDVPMAITFPVDAELDAFPKIELVDSTDAVVLECPDSYAVRPDSESQQINVTVTPWPSKGYCPSMVPTCE